MVIKMEKILSRKELNVMEKTTIKNSVEELLFNIRERYNITSENVVNQYLAIRIQTEDSKKDVREFFKDLQYEFSFTFSLRATENYKQDKVEYEIIIPIDRGEL